MAIDITIPRLGWNMDEGVFVAWHKNDGDLVRAGERIFSLESDKAVQEIESIDGGSLRILPSGPKPRETVAVGTVIGRLLQPDESEMSLGQGQATATGVVSAKAQREQPQIVPGRKSQLGSENLPDGGVAPVVARSSPRARRKAKELGLAWTTLQGTGRGGRIRERDVLAAAAAPVIVSELGPHAGTPPPSLPEGEYQSRPIDPTRRTIADRMTRSARETAAVTLTTSIDAANLVNLRQQFKAVTQQQSTSSSEEIGYTDIVIKLAALALQRHPSLNSRWDGDKILIFQGVHIGFAVDTDAGLLVPMIRDVPELSLRQVAARSKDLTDRARRRALLAADLLGGTFTVTNLGSYGIDAFTPLINYPQCAVLGMGRIIASPAASGPHFAMRDRMTLSLTFDHRIVDGAPAARFLQLLGSLLENPSPWLLP